MTGTPVDGRNSLVQLALVQQAEAGEVSISDADVMAVGEQTAALLREVSPEHGGGRPTRRRST